MTNPTHTRPALVLFAVAFLTYLTYTGYRASCEARFWQWLVGTVVGVVVGVTLCVVLGAWREKR